MLLLDVERAFDSVLHDALLHKLIFRGCNIFLVRIIYSFLNDRTFQVTVDGCELAIFADDTALFVSSSDPTDVCDGVQELLDSFTDHFKRWKIKVNSSKTQAI
jgi:hypothetical protein